MLLVLNPRAEAEGKKFAYERQEKEITGGQGAYLKKLKNNQKQMAYKITRTVKIAITKEEYILKNITQPQTERS